PLNTPLCSDTATAQLYTLSLHDALPIFSGLRNQHRVHRGVRPSELQRNRRSQACRRHPLHGREPLDRRAVDRGHGSVLDRTALRDRKSTRLNSSHVKTSYAVFCLKKKTS